MRLKRRYKQFPLHGIKIMLGDRNAKLGKDCLVVSEVPALIAVNAALSMGLTYSK